MAFLPCAVQSECGELKNQALTPISHKAAERALKGDEETVSRTLIRLALHDDDPAYVEATCLKFAGDPRVWVRRNCATCFGHLARLHQKLDLDRVMPVLQAMLDDPDVVSYAEASLDDIEIFMRRPRTKVTRRSQ